MKHLSFFQRLRRTVLCLCLVFSLSLSAATPAMAQKATISLDVLPQNIVRYLQDVEGFKQVIEMLTTITQLLTGIYNLIGGWFNTLFGGFMDALQARLAASRISDEMEIRAIDYMMNSRMNDMMYQNDLPLIMQHVPPKNAHLCRKTLITQGAAAGQPVVEQVANVITDAYLMGQRGVGEDESGPRGTMLATELRCVNKYGNPLDGYPTSCIDLKTKIGVFKRMLVDADILPTSLDGAVPLEIPNVTHMEYNLADNQAVAVSVPHAANDQQKMWLAAMNYCLQMAGPKPTPPVASQTLTEPGMRLMAEYRTTVARASALVRQCGLIVGYFSHSNSLMTDMRKEETTACKAAIGKAGKTNYFDDQTMEEKFDNCNNGMSKYQRELLARLSCKSPQSFMLSANSGVLTKEMLDEAVNCDASWNNWEAKNAAMQGSLVDIASMHGKNRAAFSRILQDMRALSRQAADSGQGSSYIPAASKSVEKKEKTGQKAVDKAVWPEIVSP